MAVTSSPSAPSPSAAPARAEHIVLEGISWETYRRLRDECDRRHLKMTYDRGVLEIMSPSPRHATIGKLIGRLVETLTLELDIPLVGLSNTTWRREDAERGCEADECYYIAHAEWAAGREAFDLSVDPPPDLVVEVDITSSSLDKQSIYADLGVPELWRFEADRLTILRLGSDGRYAPSPASAALPMLPPDVVMRFVAMRTTGATDTTIVNRFREWLQSTRPSGRG